MDDPDFGQGTHVFEDVYEVECYRVDFFNREKIERLAEGYHLEAIENFEEGDLPKRLFFVVMRKPDT